MCTQKMSYIEFFIEFETSKVDMEKYYEVNQKSNIFIYIYFIDYFFRINFT